MGVAALALVAWMPLARAQPDFAFAEAGPRSVIERAWARLETLILGVVPPDPPGAVAAWILGSGAAPAPVVLPRSVVLHPIPGHGSYRFAVIGGQRLVVDAATRTVVYVVD